MLIWKNYEKNSEPQAIDFQGLNNNVLRDINKGELNANDVFLTLHNNYDGHENDRSTHSTSNNFLSTFLWKSKLESAEWMFMELDQ